MSKTLYSEESLIKKEMNMLLKLLRWRNLFLISLSFTGIISIVIHLLFLKKTVPQENSTAGTVPHGTVLYFTVQSFLFKIMFSTLHCLI